jgi:hypothetical protein
MVNVFDCLGHWGMLPGTEEEFAGADVVATHEFGDQHVLSRSTEKIVGRGFWYAHTYGKPMICQFPGNHAAGSYGIKPVAVIEKHRNPENILIPKRSTGK